MMSNPQQHKTLLETSPGNNSVLTSRSKFALASANDQAESLSKLIDSQPELNNNSIILASLESTKPNLKPAVAKLAPSNVIPAFNSQHHLELSKQSLSDFKRLSSTAIDMDQIGSKNSSGQTEAAVARIETNLGGLASAPNSMSPQYPTNSVTSAARDPQMQPGYAHQQRQRVPLKKQPVASEQEAISTIKSLSASNKKLSTMSYDSSRDLEDEEQDQEEEEQEDDELSERSPFGASKLRPGRKLTCEPHRSSSRSPGKKPFLAADHKMIREFSNTKKAHTKISMQDNMRPPSFNTSCHPETLGGRKFESWQGYSNCACSSSSQYLKSDSNHQWRNQVQEKKPSRTKSMHLVLKSIILILLTLILAMLLMGFVAASHYLPQMFDKLLNASRSFNVTISG